jgi:hypothetical protein
MSQSSPQSACLDPLDSLLDLSEYDKLSYQSPTLSPSTSKVQFTGRAVSNTPATLLSTQQPDLGRPSHDYGMYKQQTGIPQGSVASTLAVNQQINHYGFADGGYLGFSPSEEYVDFGTAPSRHGSFNPTDMDMEFESPKTEPAFFYGDHASPEFVSPTAVAPSSSVPSQTSSVGRLWPGMHQQQAALAKAQAQQKQQQQIIQQQRNQSQQKQQPQRSRANQQTDPIVEEKISQLLNSMRQSSVMTDDNSEHSGNHLAHVQQRMRKEEEDMDEDERLLASEEGKKLSSKERRQLRNKVSARAFRSRRKEYISQLEGEIAVKVNENSDLRAQNRALLDENTRLSDLTRMLLSSPSFSGFLDTLASNPAAAQTAQAVQQPRHQSEQQQQQPQPQQQIRKDVNPYAAQQHMHQGINIALIPEHNMDFSMIDLDADGAYSYQPQVFSVLSLPEAPIDTEVLSGKTSNFTTLPSEDEKVELPKVERMPVSQTTETEPSTVVDEEFDANPAFALYSTPTPSVAEVKPEQQPELDFDLSFLNLLSPKQTIELVVVPEVSNETSDAALKRVERIAADLDACLERLSALTVHL